MTLALKFNIIKSKVSCDSASEVSITFLYFDLDPKITKYNGGRFVVGFNVQAFKILAWVYDPQPQTP